jgi:hypothetical protein
MPKQFTPKQFKAAFRTEKQCRDYIFRLKYPDGFCCKECGYHLHHEVSHRDSWQCGRCTYQESAKARTLFHKSKVKLTDWFQAIYEITISKGGISALELQARLGLGSYKTAWGMMHKLRKAMCLREEAAERIGGLIELDGAVFGRRKTKTQATAFLAVEVTRNAQGKPCAGRLKISKVTIRAHGDGNRLADEGIRAGSTVRTDAGTDVRLRLLDVAVNHEPMNMSPDKSQNAVWLKWVHRVISNIKASLLGVHHGVSPRYLDSYLGEHCYRFNRRGKRQELQSRLLQACLDAGPISVADISA